MINKNEAIKNNIKVVDNSIKNELFENLKTNFPQTIIEGKADLKAISLLLGLDKKSDLDIDKPGRIIIVSIDELDEYKDNQEGQLVIKN